VSAIEIIKAVRAAGGKLEVSGDRIHYTIPDTAAPLLPQLRRHKAELLSLLKQGERRTAANHLLPFLGKRVWSPAGPGILLVVKEFITVGLEDGTKMRWYDPTAVIPYA
jgi:hypothetical protein